MQVNKLIVCEPEMQLPVEDFDILNWSSYFSIEKDNIFSLPQLVDKEKKHLRSKYLELIYDWGEIRIDGKPVIEYDYSGMHIVLLYALKGINYWKDINKDPFDLSEYGYVNDEQMRNLLKVILNCYVNVEKGKKKSKRKQP